MHTTLAELLTEPTRTSGGIAQLLSTLNKSDCNPKLHDSHGKCDPCPIDLATTAGIDFHELLDFGNQSAHEEWIAAKSDAIAWNSSLETLRDLAATSSDREENQITRLINSTVEPRKDSGDSRLNSLPLDLTSVLNADRSTQHEFTPPEAKELRFRAPVPVDSIVAESKSASDLFSESDESLDAQIARLIQRSRRITEVVATPESISPSSESEQLEDVSPQSFDDLEEKTFDHTYLSEEPIHKQDFAAVRQSIDKLKEVSQAAARHAIVQHGLRQARRNFNVAMLLMIVCGAGTALLFTLPHPLAGSHHLKIAFIILTAISSMCVLMRANRIRSERSKLMSPPQMKKRSERL